MKALAEFLAVAKDDLVQAVRFTFVDNGMIKVELTARIHDRKYESSQVSSAEDLDTACKRALYEWVEGLKVNPPPADVPKADVKPDAKGGYQCSKCGTSISERVAKGSPPNVCRDDRLG